VASTVVAPGDAAHARRLGLLCVVVTTLGWGLNWPVLKFLLSEVPPLTARSFAGLLAGFALAAFALLRGIPMGVPVGKRGPLLLSALLNVTAWMGMATLGLQYVGAGEGAMMSYTMPAWAALMAWPVLGERPTLWRILALVLGLSGVAVLVTGQGVELSWAKLPGVALLLMSAILFALGTVWFKRHQLGLNPVVSVAWQVGLGCLPLAIASFFIEAFDPAAVSIRAWGAFLYMAAVPLCLCYLTWFTALSVLPAGVAAIGTLGTPLVGVLSGALLLGEPLGWRQAVALALTLGGIMLAVRAPAR
jgi:drug/metabolite transporter (DMT)-like permease